MGEGVAIFLTKKSERVAQKIFIERVIPYRQCQWLKERVGVCGCLSKKSRLMGPLGLVLSCCRNSFFRRGSYLVINKWQ